MIKIKVKYNDNYIKEVKITGHAGYDDYGKDIVCASSSSIVITSCNLILKLDESAIKVTQKEGLIEVIVIKEEEIVNKVLENMISMLKELSNDYKENVKFI